MARCPSSISSPLPSSRAAKILNEQPVNRKPRLQMQPGFLHSTCRPAGRLVTSYASMTPQPDLRRLPSSHIVDIHHFLPLHLGSHDRMTNGALAERSRRLLQRHELQSVPRYPAWRDGMRAIMAGLTVKPAMPGGKA